MPHRDQRFENHSLRQLEFVEPKVDDSIHRIGQRLVEIRRHTHSNPEPSGEELETTAFIAAELSNDGLAPKVCQQDIGLVADFAIGAVDQGSSTIAIRADIDALRLPDQKDVPYKSQVNGICHACGHDVHTAIALGSAFTLSAIADEFGGGAGAKLRFIFQPAEETCEGARWMVEQGVLDGVDSIIALHVDPELPAGVVGLRSGSLTASCDEVDILIEGRGGHGARPHQLTIPLRQLRCWLRRYIKPSQDPLIAAARPC